ncbi:hypothetical protein [Saccharolobus caldissimus]|uniref:Uncharacterized protein n=1 Tax=Saccharolobus caldissimus TaxID=1702097 RepID=A0AAQ4CNT3_9CREN|nr:hypothetical protein [Saccharolobus caldissimus]BDB97464.1 hypothetical protein SACC_04810 [Saccharolobus caldissimus]
MSKNIAFFLDTNILVKWIYRELLNETKDIESFISLLGKDQCIILGINLSEFESIIYDAYNITSHIIYEKILSGSDWDKLTVRDKLKIIGKIRKSFDQLYEQILKSKYNGLIPPGGIRQILAKRFFTELEERLVNSSLESLRNHVALNRKADDLVDFLSGTETVIKQRCTILDHVKILFDDDIIREIQLIHEGIDRHLRDLKSKGYKKAPSRNDQLIFQYLFLFLRERIYDEIVFITDDNDFERLYKAILGYLNGIIKGDIDPRGDLKEYAMEIRDILGKLVIKNVNDLITRQ